MRKLVALFTDEINIFFTWWTNVENMRKEQKAITDCLETKKSSTYSWAYISVYCIKKRLCMLFNISAWVCHVNVQDLAIIYFIIFLCCLQWVAKASKYINDKTNTDSYWNSNIYVTADYDGLLDWSKCFIFRWRKHWVMLIFLSYEV